MKTRGTDNTSGSLQLSPGHTAGIQPMLAINDPHLPPRPLSHILQKMKLTVEESALRQSCMGSHVTDQGQAQGGTPTWVTQYPPASPASGLLCHPALGQGGRWLLILPPVTISAAIPC